MHSALVTSGRYYSVRAVTTLRPPSVIRKGYSRAALPRSLGRSRSRPAWLPAALAAVEEELVSPRALSVLVDALADGPVALADVFLVRVRVRVRARDGPVALAGVFLVRVRIRARVRVRARDGPVRCACGCLPSSSPR